MDISPTLRSVVAVRAHIPDDAFTAAGLGTLREGSGVVIRDDGRVLTIGYLITEAEEVWLTTVDGKVVAGHALAYDQETGFGLVQPRGQRDLPALELGSSSRARVGDTAVFADGTGNSIQTGIVAKQEFAGYWEYLLDEAIFIAPALPSWGGAALVASEDYGDVLVMNVSEVSSAAKAGLQRGDIISDIRDNKVESLADFYRKVWSAGPAGAEVPMRLVRDGRDSWVRVKSADRNSFLRRPQLQ